MITDIDIETAEVAASVAAAALDAAEREAAGSDPNTVSEPLIGRLTRAGVTARQAGVRLTQLRQRRQEQDAALAARRAAEKAAKGELDTADTELAASRDRVATAVVAAEKALRGLLATAAGHDELVRRHAAALVARGLPLADGLDVEHATGGAANGCLRLRGAHWLPLSAPAVFMRTAHGVAAAVYGDRHDLARRLARFVGVAELDTRRDGLLDSAPVPKPAKAPASWSLRVVRDRAPAGLGPHLAREKLDSTHFKR